MHQSTKEQIVLQAQIELLQTSFKDSMALSALCAPDELKQQADFKLFSVSRSIKVKNNS